MQRLLPPAARDHEDLQPSQLQGGHQQVRAGRLQGHQQRHECQVREQLLLSTRR
jgi:hypothetical protein